MTDKTTPTVEGMAATPKAEIRRYASHYADYRAEPGFEGREQNFRRLDALALVHELAARPVSVDAVEYTGSGENQKPFRFGPDRLEQIIDRYVDEYEMRGDEGSHTPSDGEKYMLKDAIIGLLADEEWDAAWGKLIDKQAAALQSVDAVDAQQEPSNACDEDRRVSREAMHASAPAGCGCADCAIDGEACPTCYEAWWRVRHPNVVQSGDAVDAQQETDALEWLAAKGRASIQCVEGVWYVNRGYGTDCGSGETLRDAIRAAMKATNKEKGNV